ncbi:uncharacterized protein LOC119744916 [Patiria miniata]|uniref:Netrin receptor UNC5 n=1 Tax=Patiria miniata TaxID=46514 RepID=A0A914BMC3_PATMI|nr:uncharacterized protein LOC119744916 [Patiria miniata]
MSSSAGKRLAVELAAVYDTVRSPPLALPRDKTPTETAGGYVTPVGKFQPELDQHYQNIKHFKEIKPSFRSSKVQGKAIGGLGRSSDVVAPLLPLKPALPSKENPGSEVCYQNTPRVPTKTSGYAELRTTSPSIYSALSKGVPSTQPQRSELDHPHPQQGSMGNAPTVQPRLNRTPHKPARKPLVTYNPRASNVPWGSSEATSHSPQKDVSDAKPSQALIEGPLCFRNPMPASRRRTEFLTEIHTPDPALDEVLRKCQTAMEHYASEAAEGRIIFTTDRFACGMFDHRGGFLPLPNHKITLYVTPHAIVGDNPEPIFIFIHPDPPTALLDLETGVKPISPTVVCGKTGLKFSSDVVLSFPVKTQDTSAAARHQIIVSEQTSPSEKPKQQVMDKILDCFFSVDDNRCTMMVNQLGSFTVVSQAPIKTEEFRGRYASQPSDEFLNYRVGVFGRQLAGTGSAQIRVIFWKDSDAETQRIVAEEGRDRFRKLDRVRMAVISKYRRAVWVTASHVIPGWTMLTKDKERLSVERFISQHRKDGCLPSCTFALYRDTGGSASAQTPRVASCTIEVSQDGGYADEVEEDESETVQFVAVVDEESTAPVIPTRLPSLPGSQMSPTVPQRVPLNQKASIVTFTPLLKPPAGLRHKILGELSLHLEVSVISGRGWKLLAQKMGLSAPHICCLRERYLCPGQALLNWYLGQQVALVATREALRRLLDLFRDMDWPELQTILTREIQNTDNNDPGQDWSTKPPRCYEIIDDDANQAMKGAVDKGVAKSSPRLQRKNSYEAPSERNRIPVPSPRSSPKTVIKRNDPVHQVKKDIPDAENQTTVRQDAERQHKSPFNQNLHFTSSGSERIISPASSPTGYFYQPPLTQLPKPTLWNTAHNVLQHKKSQSGAPPQREDGSNSTLCQDAKQQSGFEEQPPPIPLLSPNEDAIEAAANEENPYLQPDVKDKVGPLWTMEKPHSIRPTTTFNKKLKAPTPPQRTTSVRMRKGRLQMPHGSQQVEPSTVSLPKVPDILSASDQIQHEREHDEEVIYECHQEPDQIPSVEEHPQYAASLQLKKKALQDILMKKILKATGREEADPEVRRHSTSSIGSIPESVYDDVEILLQENKDLEMMQEEPGGRQLVEKILKSSAIRGLLSKIPRNTSKKKIPPFPEELKSTAVNDDMVCYEPISGPEVPARTFNRSQEAESSGAVVKKTAPDVKPRDVADERCCYEEINEPKVPPRTIVPGCSGASYRKPLPQLPTSIDNRSVMHNMDVYEDTSSLTVPTQTGSQMVQVKTTSGELKTVRKFVPKTVPRAVPPKPEETYEVMPIGQGGVQRP